MRKQIFVFGSNLAGIHGAGSSLEARRRWGAKNGVGIGRTGDAYAIPTKDRELKRLSLAVIEMYVGQFVEYAKDHPELEFGVVRIGCGLAGYKESQIAPMFLGATKNVDLPTGWREMCNAN